MLPRDEHKYLQRLTQLDKFAPLLTVEPDYLLQKKGYVTIKEEILGGSVFSSTNITPVGGDYIGSVKESKQ